MFYAIPLYIAGLTQFEMWRDFTEDGLLRYPNFLETVTQLVPMYALRSVGGALYLVGFIVMIYNLVKTALAGKLIAEESAEAAPLAKIQHAKYAGEGWHRWIERRPMQMLVMSLVVILIGGVIEMIPTFLVKENIPTIASVQPYTALELQGRDIYLREGCYTCHSQMIRPFRFETERYGEYSKAGEFVYDHPFQWGSKRTGPDLQREGGKYPNSWHYNHMYDPTSMSPGSLMPPYPWLIDDDLDTSTTAAKIRAMQTMGVPYPAGYASVANLDLSKQANEIAKDLLASGIETSPDKEIIAMIAYLQRLGIDIKGQNKVIFTKPTASK
jgi:cytochrome c oxidase cbb3-type subunit I/II